jgi:hypothetical protein
LNRPPRPRRRVVLADTPRDQTGSPVSRISQRSVTGPSTTIPASPWPPQRRRPRPHRCVQRISEPVDGEYVAFAQTGQGLVQECAVRAWQRQGDHCSAGLHRGLQRAQFRGANTPKTPMSKRRCLGLGKPPHEVGGDLRGHGLAIIAHFGAPGARSGRRGSDF